jgi:hypothetical protein
LRDCHGIKKSGKDIMQELDMDDEPMTIDEARNWIQSIWIGQAVEGIPVLEGLKCMECQYSALTQQVMRNHLGLGLGVKRVLAFLSSTYIYAM